MYYSLEFEMGLTLKRSRFDLQKAANQLTLFNKQAAILCIFRELRSVNQVDSLVMI